MIKDLGKLMKQAQEMQAKMTSVQADLGGLEITGSAGGGMVTVTLSGTGVMTGVEINESLMVASEREILEDLMIAAHTDAKAKVEAAVAEKMKEVTGGLALPPGFNLGG